LAAIIQGARLRRDRGRHTGNIVGWNAAASRIFGLARLESLGKHDVDHPERLRPSPQVGFDKSMDTGRRAMDLIVDGACDSQDGRTCVRSRFSVAMLFDETRMRPACGP